jgi:hypothetical protein
MDLDVIMEPKKALGVVWLVCSDTLSVKLLGDEGNRSEGMTSGP